MIETMKNVHEMLKGYVGNIVLSVSTDYNYTSEVQELTVHVESEWFLSNLVADEVIVSDDEVYPFRLIHRKGNVKFVCLTNKGDAPKWNTQT